MKPKYLLFTLVVFLFACSEKDELQEIDLGEFALKAFVDGKELNIESDKISAFFYQNAGNAGSGLGIGCKASDVPCFSLRYVGVRPIPEDYKEGPVNSFNMSYYTDNGEYFNYNYTAAGTEFTNQADIPLGQLEITKLTDKIVEGTFSFVGYNYDTDTKVNVTEGQFSASIN